MRPFPSDPSRLAAPPGVEFVLFAVVCPFVLLLEIVFVVFLGVGFEVGFDVGFDAGVAVDCPIICKAATRHSTTVAIMIRSIAVFLQYPNHLPPPMKTLRLFYRTRTAEAISYRSSLWRAERDSIAVRMQLKWGRGQFYLCTNHQFQMTNGVKMVNLFSGGQLTSYWRRVTS